MKTQFRAQLQQQHQEGGKAPDDAGQASGEAVAEGSGDTSGASAGKAGTGSGKPGKSARAPRGKSLDQRRAAADKLHGVGSEEPPGDPAEEDKADQGDESKADEKSPDKKPEKTSGESPTDLAPAAKTALGSLLSTGKLAELADALGVDRKAVDASSAKLAISRKRQQDAEASERNAKEIREDCKRLYRDPHAARKAVDEGRFHDAAQYIEKVLGIGFAEFTRHVASATKGMDKDELARYQKEREIKAREDALAEKERKAQTERSEGERMEKACATIRSKLGGHQALKLKGGDKLVYSVLDAAFDPKTGTLSKGYKQAADEVLAEFLENAKALGLAPKSEAPAEKKTDAEKNPDTATGKREFKAPDGEHQDESTGKPKRGRSLEERAALASRQFERSRPR